MNAAFFDTNIMIYAVDPRDAEREKRGIARSLLGSRQVYLSTQVMMEAFNVLVKKKLARRDIASAYIRRLSSYVVAMPESEDVLRAIDYSDRYNINHFDALHICAAEQCGVSVIYSEDLSHGQHYGRVRACNPFKKDFLA